MSTCSAYDELKYQKEKLHYMDSAEAAIKRDTDLERKSAEAALKDQYESTSRTHFDNAAKVEKKYTDQY